jgi:hypothetical protein
MIGSMFVIVVFTTVVVGSMYCIVGFTTVVDGSMFGIVAFVTVIDSSMLGFVVDFPGVATVVVSVRSPVVGPKLNSLR